MEAVKFVTPAPTDVTLVPFENPEMGIQGVAPEGWEQVSNGVFSRQHSSLDVALILQQAAALSAQETAGAAQPADGTEPAAGAGRRA